MSIKDRIPNIKQVNEVVWEIPKTYKEGMQVPARIYSTEKLLNQMEDTVINQLTNVACLPGIVKHALCMPDGHSGYGFPIGGVAAFDSDKGIISPGGIGFDINCLAKGSKILTEYGYTKEIQDFETDFIEIDIPSQYNLKARISGQSIASFDITEKKFMANNAIYFMKKKHSGKIIRIKTKLGYMINVTADHPIFTDNGMIKAGELKNGINIAIQPFEGVHYQEPNLPSLNESEFTEKEINELRQNNLFPLTIDTLAIITKLFGYLLGDGQIYISNNRGFTCAYGSKDDLESIKKDFAKIGYSAGIYGRKRNHEIPTKYGIVKFSAENYELHVSSKSLAKLFYALGYPKGIKTNTEYLVPTWILKSPLWIKRLFLAGLLGAELSKPRTHTKTGFDCPTLSMNKNTCLLDNARQFCIQIMVLLEEFSIKSHKLLERPDFYNKQGKTSRLKLQISSEETNLLKLWSNIGFEYNKKRSILSNLAILYIKEKAQLTQKRLDVSKRIKELKQKGLKLKEIQMLLESKIINKRFIIRHFYENAGYRITFDFPSFTDYVNAKMKEIDLYGCVFDAIDVITVEEYDDQVYDFNIAGTHNFIANNVVVSNCGMRLIKTDLTIKEVQPKIKDIVDLLFKTVPAGVGGKGFVPLQKKQFEEVMTTGVKWCVENGYGWKKDLERIEENGCIKQADISKVSQRAVQRGINQLGTLGSGNHYLEVQMIKAGHIFDAQIAKKLGIFGENQVLIMVHCGSRGFGHQIGSDYLQTFEPAMKKYNITVKDRELACAPFNSKEGQDYYKAMACAANMAFANRQVIIHRVREAFAKLFDTEAEKLGMDIIYDVAHNIAKLETFKIDGKKKELLVHRKGSTRSFGPSRKELASIFRETGQPVIIGGSMETGSYLCVGTDKADEETFGSTMHGSGRTMSRTQAKKTFRGEKLQKDMATKGIYIRAVSMSGLAEEAGSAYKDINEVVDTMDVAGVSKKIVALSPIGNVKG